ncbi:MAG: methylenetetrahydromethanopterin dehydrogenase [Caldiserica bacterium]|nr:methylenetetrahydromethanopterin dehydrogenase [Caldisericota bacterium]MDH7562010.1 methylene-tetrahydromethanopterin dehydrogenase N-terminal domain-containing protein [Caldisericota bacterium]
MKNILIYLDTDKRASIFDILFSYDAGFDVVVPLGGVTADEVRALVQDAMFPRGPQGAKCTTLFFGGSNPEESEEMAEIARKTMFPPFLLSVIIDPKGAITTSSAMVAKAAEALKMRNETLKGKKALILAGTGPVGRIAARILLKEGAEVILTSRSLQKAEEIADKVTKKVGLPAKGAKAETPEEVFALAQDCDLLFATGAAGVELIPQKFVEQLERCLVAVDVNAVPPSGIGGVSPGDDKKEVGKVLGIGALAVGGLRNKIARQMLQVALEKGGSFLDYESGYQIAREIVGF